ncbi:MAG TPA: hypothetical protein PLE50_00045 [Rhabdaerophilum sp.]|nr:hypothetical protein [Rhabdaerophilum sp.]
MGSPGELKDWLSVLSTALAIGAIVYSWLTRTGKEAGEKVVKLEGKLDAAVAERDRKIDLVEDRIARVEGELKGVPDRESVHKMQLEMERMRGTIEVLNERLVPLAAISGRLQEFLLEQSKRA